MRLSTVFELLLIFLFIAFAASRSVDKHHHHHHHHKHGSLSKSRQAPAITKPATAAPNRYCQCTSVMCNCCRDFSLPVVSLKGPGCANLQYLTGDSMRLTMSFGDRILRNITLSGKKPRPVCMGLPGAETKFCGRIYGIQRTGDQFKACLALEMRSLDEIEAALRVACFKFGSDGVKLEPGRPVPDTDDYDDDDDYGLDDEDDEDDDDDDFLADDEDDEEDNDVDSGDYTGFSALGDEFLDGFFGSGPSKKKKKIATTPSPVKATKKPISSSTTQKTVEKMNTTTTVPNIQEISTPGKVEGNISTAEELSESSTNPTIQTSTMLSVKVMQEGNTLEESINTNTSTETAPKNPEKIMVSSSTMGITTSKATSSTPATNGIDSKKDAGGNEDDEEDEEEQEDDDAEEEEEEEGSTSELIENTKEKEKVAPQSKDDDERNILDGILGEDDDEEENEKVGGGDEEDDEEEDEFRQLRSHVPRGPYQPMTLEDQERQFPGLSALIKPPSVPFMSLQEQERRFPGLAALIRPPAVSQQQPEIAFDFPPVRSARTHRRMRLPPV